MRERERNGSFYFKNLFLETLRELVQPNFPFVFTRARHRGWDPALRVVEGLAVGITV